MTIEEAYARAIEVGSECGTASGETLRAIQAQGWPEGLSPILRSAFELECIGRQYRRITDAEDHLREAGASDDVASAFRISALVSLLVRLGAAPVTPVQ